MILKEMVRAKAREKIDSVFREQPSMAKYLLRKEMFEVFVDKLHMRLNELADFFWLKRLNMTKTQIDNFIETTTERYAIRQLELGEQSEGYKEALKKAEKIALSTAKK